MEAAYFEAIRAGDLDRLEALVGEQPALLGARSPDDATDMETQPTGLHVAVYAGRLDAARLLIDAGIDLEAMTTEGRTALHDSIECGRVAFTDLLLDRGARVDICSAAILGRIERVRELLDADPELANDHTTYLSPLGWAAFGNQVDTARELLDRGARMDDGELLCAASVGHVEVGRLLIERGADPNEVHADAGANALHAAAAMKYSHDSSGFIRMLLDHGADATIPEPGGRTALEIAELNARDQDKALADAPDDERRNYDDVIRLLRAGD